MDNVKTDLPLPSPIRQIDGLQMLRFVAVLLVIWVHVSQRVVLDGGHVLPSLGVFGIDIFFVISGFIVSTVAVRSPRRHGPAAAWSFLMRRLIRIYPLYWIVFILDAVRIFHARPSAIRPYIPDFFLLPCIGYPHVDLLLGVSWTLIFEMFFYVVLSIILLFTVRRSTYAVLGLLGLLVVSGRFFDIRHPYLIVFCNPFLLEFLFGCIIALLYRKAGSSLRTLGIVLSVLGWCAAVTLRMLNLHVATGLQMGLANQLVFTRVFTWGIAAALIVGGMIFWNPSAESTFGRVPVLLGNASYSIYLISEFDQNLLLRFFRLFTHTRNYTSWSAAFAVQLVLVLASLSLGLLVYFAIERPVLRCVSKLLLPRRESGLSRATLTRHERPALHTRSE
jgi:exopolysaccharide production protein ExoZ